MGPHPSAFPLFHGPPPADIRTTSPPPFRPQKTTGRPSRHAGRGGPFSPSRNARIFSSASSPPFSAASRDDQRRACRSPLFPTSKAVSSHLKGTSSREPPPVPPSSSKRLRETSAAPRTAVRPQPSYVPFTNVLGGRGVGFGGGGGGGRGAGGGAAAPPPHRATPPPPPPPPQSSFPNPAESFSLVGRDGLR